ncbi:hypothetical protein [Modestobacter italicus]|uniref:hypothetical protein n=1 Tax=Modestobacter italicus (strain DSM 44449 / CECT 9708 / BC 501) TaxID=2732864 RepID=UPI001C989E9E|nr:hypothetical protein [Modestobacter italicus]
MRALAMLGAEMSEPDEKPSATRALVAGAVVLLVALGLGLAALALQPRTTTAAASLTVTPRTDAGADAAVLLADRYATLADSATTLRTAWESTPQLSDVALEEVQEGTTVDRADRTAAITVRVTLDDRDAAVAAANAVVDTLVEQGADEDLVDVDRGAEATPARVSTSPDTTRWVLVTALLALAAGLATAALATGTGRRRHVPGAAAGLPPASAGTGVDHPAEVVDDLPGFLENPPGSVPALPAAAPAPSSVTSPAEPPTRTGSTRSGAHREAGTPVPRRTRGAALGAALLLVLAAVAVAATGDRPNGAPGPALSSQRTLGPDGVVGPTGPAEGAAATLSAPTDPAVPGLDATEPTTTVPAGASETRAAALALASVPLGEDGVAASISAQGLVLEQRAVGLTVTYPSLSVSTDGRRSLAHVRLPTFNCLTAEPPADPVAAGCVRSLTEYADLASPQLQLTRDGDRIELVGLFPTYTRPNGSAPVYTGRAYQLAATVTPAGPRRDGSTPAAGVVRIGLDSAPTTSDAGVNRLQHPG